MKLWNYRLFFAEDAYSYYNYREILGSCSRSRLFLAKNVFQYNPIGLVSLGNKSMGSPNPKFRGFTGILLYTQLTESYPG